jgi:hypothetical protein
MTDVCDDAFFRAHVWPLLLKDVRLLLTEESSNVSTDAVQRAAEREFVVRQYKMAQLTARGSSQETLRSPERELQLAAMQSYALMYDATLSLARQLIEAERWNLPAAPTLPAPPGAVVPDKVDASAPMNASARVRK